MIGTLDEAKVLSDILIEQLRNSNASKSVERRLNDEINKLKSQFDEVWRTYKEDEGNDQLNLDLRAKYNYILQNIHHDISIYEMVKKRLFN